MNVPRTVELYDTTLRDGTQRAGISLSVDDKVKILQRLDAFGMGYVEGGWPGSNPKDAEFFTRAKDLPLQATTLTAFGMTRRPNGTCDDDPNLRALVEAGAPVACIVGKSWTMHVTEALRTTFDENLAMVADSVEWLKSQGLRVFFDAEHFFDGFKNDKAYALAVIEAAAEAGAEIVVLCDTNGGTLPNEVFDIFSDVTSRIDQRVGGHFHDDAGCGVANSLAAVRAGGVQIQGCVNGYGERCGNADILSVAANLELKMDVRALPSGKIAELTEVSRFVSEVCNIPLESHRSYVGSFAFAHKGGLHVSAVVRNANAYEHIDPAIVGNDRHLVTSDLSGAATLKARTQALHLTLDADSIKRALGRVKQLEYEGYSFEAADGSLELLLREASGWKQEYFEPLGFRTIVEAGVGAPVGGGAPSGVEPTAEATVRVMVKGKRSVTVAEGHGPVDSLNQALRTALRPVYPVVDAFHLTDYKVRVLDPESATAAKVRVLVETSNTTGSWMTVGVSENIIEASWKAVLDSIVVGFLRHKVE